MKKTLLFISLFSILNAYSDIKIITDRCDKLDYIACSDVGVIYEKDRKNYKTAIKYYKKSCNGEYNVGCSNLGAMYQNGKGVDKNFNIAKKYYKKSCDDGFMTACSNLGILYILKDKKYFKDAVPLFEKSCSANNAYGCRNLGSVYFTGSGVKKDITKAKKYYKRGCDLNDYKSCQFYNE